MAITQRPQRDGDTGGVLKTTNEVIRMGRLSGWMPTVFSAVAVGMSCISVYMSTLQGAKLEVYVPPTIHYGRDAGGDTELFAIPVTIANDGARSAAVLSIELEVQNLKTNATKRYYSAFLGEHPREAHNPQPPVRAVELCRPRPVLRHRALLPSGRGSCQGWSMPRASTSSACSSTRPPRKRRPCWIGCRAARSLRRWTSG